MADVADLIMRASVPGAEQAVQALDRLDKGAARAERSAESLGASSARLSRQMQQAEAAIVMQQRAMTGVVGSSKALNGALLNLSRQFADVGVSVASGINPMMILIQQGPQVADAFALAKTQGVGFSAVMRGLGSQLAGFAVRGGLVGAAVGGLALLGAALIKGSDEAAKFQNTITATGNAAGLTAQSYEDMAARIGKSTDVSVRSAKAGISQLAATGRFSAETIETLVSAAERYSKLTGESASEILKDYAAMTDGVTKWAAKHATVYHDLSVAQIERIQQLEKAGRSEEAYQLAASGIKESVDQRMAPAYGYLQQLLHDTGRAASDMWDKILGLGRPKTIEQQIGDARAKIASMQSAAGGATGAAGGFGAQVRANASLNLRAQQQRLGVLEMLKQGQDAKAAADAAKAQKEADEIRRRFLTPKTSVGGRQDRTEQEMAAATRAELAARQQLTKNVQEIAAIKLREIDAELQGQIAQVETNKAIKAAQKPAIEQAYRNAAAAKREAVYREELAGLIGQGLSQQRALNDLADRASNAQDSLSHNAAEQNAVATARLARQQAFEREEQAYQDGLLVLYGQITQAEAERRKAALAAAQFGEALVQAEQNRVRLAHEVRASEQSALEVQMAALEAQADLSLSTYARNVIGLKILDVEQQIALSKAQEAIDVAKVGSVERQRAEQAMAALRTRQETERALAKRETRLVDAISAAADAVDTFKGAFRRHDWARVFDALVGTIQTIQAAFASQGMGGGLMAAGSAVAGMVGGKTGRAIGGGLGIAGMGMSFGAFMGSGAGLAMAGGLGGAIGGAAGAAVANGLLAVGAVAAPLAIAAGALYAAAKIFNIGGKPTNAGAGYDLRTGAISGNKRTSETEEAARSAGEAIQGIQDALKAAGIGLTDAVTGLVIGTRDQTQIYLQSGQTLRSAVGDSGAAVDTAMRALLSSATYVSDAQKALVDSALAAGKGFDAIAEILAKYEAAQNIAKSIDDEILRLTDTKAYDLKTVRDAIEEQRKAAQQLATDGYLTADQLAVITGKLATLEGLQLEEVLKRYGQAVSAAADATQASKDIAAGATEAARSALVEAYNREADALRETIDRFSQLADSMKDFRAELTSGSLAGLNPFAQYRASSQAFSSARADLAANPGDAAAYGAFQTASRQFLEASKAIAPGSAMYDRDLAAVRVATEEAEKYARAQIGTAEAQLAQLTATVGQLVQLNAGVVTVAQAIANLQNALIVERQLGMTPTANDNFDVNRYLAAGPDLAQNWMEGGILRQYGATLQEAATAHYRLQGIGEIAQGIRKYADGGMHPGGLRLVGERGPELEVTGPARYFSAEDTQAMFGGAGGDNADVVAELRQVRAEIAQVRRASDRTALELQKMVGNGLYVRGRAPDDPVTTEAA